MTWIGGGSELVRLNPDSDYEPGDPHNATEYDIEVSLCLNCGAFDRIVEYAESTS